MAAGQQRFLIEVKAAGLPGRLRLPDGKIPRSNPVAITPDASVGLRPPSAAGVIASLILIDAVSHPNCRAAARLDDVVGLYMNPPRHAVVVSIDEKSQIQALDRTQPGLPLKRGKCATMTHDYKRNGTTTLFAPSVCHPNLLRRLWPLAHSALSVLEGKVIGRCVPRHCHQEFIRFIATVERSVHAGKVIHAILDNYAAHKHPNVLAWLADHPRWTFHFTPTSCSWLNAVEGFFSKLTRQSLKRGVSRSVEDLEAAITRYVAATNRNPTPFVWTATARAIRTSTTLSGVEPAGIVLDSCVSG